MLGTSVAVNQRTMQNPSYRESYTGGGLPFFLLRSAILFFIPLIITQGTLFQAQLLLLHGRLIVSTVELKAIVIFLFLVGMLLRARISGARVWTVTLVFTGFVILDGLRFFFALHIAGLDVIQGVNNYYSFVYVALLALLVPYGLSERRLLQVFTWTFIVSALIGVAQFVANSPILPTQSSDGSFQVTGYEDFGTFRPFSLFLNTERFSLIGVMAAALGVVLWRQRRRLFGGPMFLGGCLVVAICKSRMNYPALVGAVIASFLLSRGSRKRWHRLMPVLWLLFGVSIAIFAYILSSTGGATGTVTDTSTLTMRLNNWASYLADFTTNDPMGIFFGYGIVESHVVGSNAAIVPIDNFFLATALDLGVVGVVLSIWLGWALWREVLTAAEETRSPLAISVAATFSTFLCLGIFQATFEPVSTYFILYAVSHTATFRKARMAEA